MPTDGVEPSQPTGRAVQRLTPFRRMELGLRAASRQMHQQDRVWARYSNDA
jgi:hypothetical protein